MQNSELIIFNSLSHKKELFKPKGKTVGIYVCGITPYDVTHLGHAATYIFFDLVARYLRNRGFKINYIQNITDVDDDLLKKAQELNTDYRSLTANNFRLFLNDLSWLNIIPPTFYPRATDHINEIINFNLKLQKKGFAYEKKGNLYFDIGKFSAFGRLSRLKKHEMLPISAQRGNNIEDPNKKNPLDFVLWQESVQGEPSWVSPWSLGRPGWHIECSCMSNKYLGDTFDIHGGGEDLIYPHHESEIAQSQAVTGKPLAKFFMHTAMLYYKGQKMSKSLGNMIFVKDLREKYSPNVLRLLILNNHYRKSWEYNTSLLTDAENLNKVFKKVWTSQSGIKNELDIKSEKNKFFSSINNDFNTPQALESLKVIADKIIQNENKNTASAKYFLNVAFNILGLQVEY